MTVTVMGFDYGTHSIGVAIGQDLTCSARPLPAVRADRGTPDWRAIDKAVKEWKPDRMVLGLPLNMDGTNQNITLLASKFAEDLRKRYEIPCDMHDERLTTTAAREYLFANGGYRALKKDKIPLFHIIEYQFRFPLSRFRGTTEGRKYIL